MLGIVSIFLTFIHFQSEWNWSIHPEAGFKVLTPVVLVHEPKSISTDVTTIELHQYRGGSVSDSLTSLVFAIDHYVLPESEGDWSDEEITMFFDETLQQLIEILNGKVVYSDVLHQPGREVCIWKGQYDEGRGVVKGQLMIDQGNYYGLLVFGQEKNNPDAAMTKFLDSFRRLNQKEN